MKAGYCLIAPQLDILKDQRIDTGPTTEDLSIRGGFRGRFAWNILQSAEGGFKVDSSPLEAYNPAAAGKIGFQIPRCYATMLLAARRFINKKLP